MVDRQFFRHCSAQRFCSRHAANPCRRQNREHIRGAIQNLDGQVLTVATSAGSVRVRLEPSTRVATVVQSDRARITDGSFLGITSVTESEVSRRAVEVHVFPEAMRGTGEGSYGWDWPGASGNSKMTNGTASKMTNATVSKSKMTNGTATTQVGGSSLTVQYKDGASGGSQTIKIPPGVPVVAIEPGQSRDLQPGMHIFVIATRDHRGLIDRKSFAGRQERRDPVDVADG
jgi:hypothetical protein